MKLRLQSFFLALACLSLFSVTAQAQGYRGVRGQIFLPNGAPVQRSIRFYLTTDNGIRNEYHYTDSNGRIQMPAVTGPYTVTVETDGETYDTTVVKFDTQYVGNYITIHLKPLLKAPGPAPGVIEVNDVDRNVKPEARKYYEEALTLLKQDQFEQALAPLKRALEIQPDYFHAANDLGVAYMKLNRLDLAIATLQRAISINRNIYLPQLNLGIVYNRLEKYKEASDALLKLRRRFPDLDKVHLPLVEALIGAQDWPRAEQEIKMALSIRSLDAVDLKTKLGTVFLKQGKFADAVGVLREATAQEPDYALAQFNYGAALMQTGSLDEAEAALARAYKIEGAKMAGAQMLLGMIYSQKQNAQKAIEAFETYLRDLPDAPNAAQVKEAIARLRREIKQQ
ncbi:MAG: tetratricopeptide repeat protein [Acidobacteriota bacterium]